jgi:V/A-type H+/Na+-transporting ATPase subunit E
MASTQVQITLKQEITSILSKAVLDTPVKSAISENEFIKELIINIIGKWEKEDSKKIDLEILLPEKLRNDFLDFFKSKAKGLFNAGLNINFDERMETGFRISQKEGSFQLSFTDKDFIQFFQSFLKPKTREILFSGK